ncbi:hypothetical protein [Kutzneria sp. NPDC052558]|uniref:hypothetical protein n=1 Tax=Kutzneria sp. NPDC052558 TaxID=3364121 RepID=UPI0037C5EF24
MVITCEIGGHLYNPIVAEQLRSGVENGLRRGRCALAELAAIITDTRDPRLRARLIPVQQELSGQPSLVDLAAPLSPREIDTLRLVEVGASNLEIAARLG